MRRAIVWRRRDIFSVVPRSGEGSREGAALGAGAPEADWGPAG
ncbi:hypothetical protein HMPREF1550_02724, partial [Actinomyces sp. oral taxon 877 str. F0543]